MGKQKVWSEPKFQICIPICMSKCQGKNFTMQFNYPLLIRERQI